jgi:hypothetical protein
MSFFLPNGRKLILQNAQIDKNAVKITAKIIKIGYVQSNRGRVPHACILLFFDKNAINRQDIIKSKGFIIFYKRFIDPIYAPTFRSPPPQASEPCKAPV